MVSVPQRAASITGRAEGVGEIAGVGEGEAVGVSDGKGVSVAEGRCVRVGRGVNVTGRGRGVSVVPEQATSKNDRISNARNCFMYFTAIRGKDREACLSIM